MKALLYINTEMLAELKRNYSKIKGLFNEDVQATFDEFLLGLERNGTCSTEECNNIYSILNNIHADRIWTKERANVSPKACDDEDEKVMMDILETLRMQFAMKYYFSVGEKKDVIRNNQYRNEVIK